MRAPYSAFLPFLRHCHLLFFYCSIICPNRLFLEPLLGSFVLRCLRFSAHFYFHFLDGTGSSHSPLPPLLPPAMHKLFGMPNLKQAAHTPLFWPPSYTPPPHSPSPPDFLHFLLLGGISSLSPLSPCLPFPIALLLLPILLFHTVSQVRKNLPQFQCLHHAYFIFGLRQTCVSLNVSLRQWRTR